MNPATHFLLGWAIAGTACVDRRERAFVTAAAVAPDLDGAGLILDLFSQGPGQASSLWDRYHHILCHNIGFGLFLGLLAAAFTARRRIVTLLVFASFHLHLLGDLLGSKGPDGYQWPIPYLLPFSEAWQWTWSGQWQLTSWPNVVITLVAGMLMFRLAWQRGVSPLEFLSPGANELFVATLRNRFGRPGLRRDLSGVDG